MRFIILFSFSCSILFVFVKLIYLIVTTMEVPEFTNIKQKRTESYEYIARQRKKRHTPLPNSTSSTFTTKKARQATTKSRSYKKYAAQASNSNKIKNRY